nr:YchJ family metal-binding protein [Shewanella sp. NIFS-20-20]
MRSRYCAFAMAEFRYILDTTHPDYLGDLTLEILAQDPVHWLSLAIENHGEEANTGWVTFCAWYRAQDDIDAIHEHSQFIRIDEQWFYTQGQHLPVKYPQRNQLCVCLSGKKSKQCCLK